MKWRIMYGLVVVMGMMPEAFCASTSSNTVKKVFHNKTNSSHSGPYIELGSIVLYFSAPPSIKQISLIPGPDGERRSFLIENTSIDAGLLEKLNKDTGDGYRVRVSSVTKPSKGLLFEVTYDPKRVDVEVKKYPAVTMEPSAVFHFYNKPFLKRLAKSSKPITSIAFRDTSRIVIDCGHGGSDYGAVSCEKIAEKDVSLSVGLELAQLLKEHGFSVKLSRDQDVAVALDERSTFANTSRADVFVSIHANASPNKAACGVETYCIAPNLFQVTAEACDNACASLCQQLMHDRYAKSARLAANVHSSLVQQLHRVQLQVVDRHVRNAVPQVLLGAGMPAILVEIGFLSHPEEAKLLADASYQKHVARGISSGIISFLKTNA